MLNSFNTAEDFANYVRNGEKIGAIKTLRAMLNVGLKEAKDMVETLPQFRAVGVPLSASMQVRVEPEATPNQWAHYIVHSNDGHYDNVVHFKGASWNFDDAMNYAQGRMDDCDEKVTVAKVIATTKRTLVTL